MPICRVDKIAGSRATTPRRQHAVTLPELAIRPPVSVDFLKYYYDGKHRVASFHSASLAEVLQVDAIHLSNDRAAETPDDHNTHADHSEDCSHIRH